MHLTYGGRRGWGYNGQNKCWELSLLDHNVPQPWQGHTTLVFALAATAIGVGNLFRFPYLLGEHGGAPFFIAYVATLLLVVVPVLVAEVMLGSHGRGSPLGALRWATDQSGRSVAWSWLGVLQALAGLFLAVEMVQITAWLLDRAELLYSGRMAAASAADLANDFVAVTENHPRMWLLIAALLIVAAALSAFGIQVAMLVIGWLVLPAMAVGMLGLLDYSLSKGDIKLAGEFLFSRQYDSFNFAGVMAGMTSALCTMAAGVGVGLCFGARTPREVSLLRSVAAAAVIDTAFAVALAVAVQPLLFASNTLPAEGLALVFVAIPYAYSNLSLGDIYGALFFGIMALACFAALTVFMQPAIQILRQQGGLRRISATVLVGCCVFGLAFLLTAYGATGLAVLDFSLSGVVLPLCMFLITIFVGWRMPRPIVRGELYREPYWLFVSWWELLRLIAPTVIGIIILWRLIA